MPFPNFRTFFGCQGFGCHPDSAPGCFPSEGKPPRGNLYQPQLAPTPTPRPKGGGKGWVRGSEFFSGSGDTLSLLGRAGRAISTPTGKSGQGPIFGRFGLPRRAFKYKGLARQAGPSKLRGPKGERASANVWRWCVPFFDSAPCPKKRLDLNNLVPDLSSDLRSTTGGFYRHGQETPLSQDETSSCF